MTGSGRERVVTVHAVGAHGDGVADDGGTALFVPDAAPGDVLRVLMASGGRSQSVRPLELVKAGPGRADPVCPHFGLCGGCRLQHLNSETYLAWKRDQVVRALTQRGFSADLVGPPVTCPPASRRRVRLAARRHRGGVILGFNERASSRIVDIAECPIARPEIVDALPGLRRLLQEVGNAPALDVSLAVLADGLDVVLHGPAELTLATRQALADFAESRDLARLSWAPHADAEPEPIAHRRAGFLAIGSVRAAVPPGGFLQASAEGESALIDLVRAGSGPARRIADLYCGVGIFGLALTDTPDRAVLAVDGDAAAVRSLRQTVAGTPDLSGRFDVELRNLRRRPLTPDQLNRHDAVILDPPRHGAQQQVVALAQSTVPRLVSVSCNPTSFARDARILVDGGYRLDRVVPVDQFLWSTHIELVGLFHRD